jgi:isoleucyl-tRNA synthetase
LIGKSLQAEVNLTVTQEIYDAIRKLDMKINQVLIVSKVNLKIGDKLDVEIKLADGSTCVRCWNVFESLNEDGLCERCSHVIKGE